jgi:hypothetical protein
MANPAESDIRSSLTREAFGPPFPFLIEILMPLNTRLSSLLAQLLLPLLHSVLLRLSRFRLDRSSPLRCSL